MACQRLQLAAKFRGEVRQAIQVRLHAHQFALRLLLATAVFEHASRLFDKSAAFLRAGFQDLRQPPLPHNHMHFAANTGIAQQFLNVHQAGTGAVNFVFAGSIAEHAARHRDFRIINGQSAIGVIDGQRHFRSAQGFAIPRTGENNILHFAAAQCFRALLPHHPRQGIHHIGFARPIRPHHGANTRLEFQGR